MIDPAPHQRHPDTLAFSDLSQKVRIVAVINGNHPKAARQIITIRRSDNLF